MFLLAFGVATFGGACGARLFSDRPHCKGRGASNEQKESLGKGTERADSGRSASVPKAVARNRYRCNRGGRGLAATMY